MWIYTTSRAGPKRHRRLFDTETGIMYVFHTAAIGEEPPELDVHVGSVHYTIHGEEAEAFWSQLFVKAWPALWYADDDDV